MKFRLWAPQAETVMLELGDQAVAMTARDAGWHEAEIDASPGQLYAFRVGDLVVPDPASRFQDGDVHGRSVVVDPDSYLWRHPDWRGRPWHEAVIYELHVGVMGGFAGVTERLPYLADLGVTALELMPIADFPGGRNWGYDGVLPYAPDADYGTPDELKHLIDTAHGLNLMVMLDVVYNHFGPDGNYLAAYAAELYRRDRHTPWGDAIDFRQQPVRRFFIENALYWLREFRFDGLRFDAVHSIADPGFLGELAAEIRQAVPREIHLVLENEENDSDLLRTGAGGAENQAKYDAQWADDLHHCLHVMLTGETEAYYADFAADPAGQLARCLAEGFAYQGDHSDVHGQPRGKSSTHLPTTAFVVCLQNHDQVGNRAFGERIGHLADAAKLRAATVLLLLAPQIPLLFMGQEFAASAPFLFFTSHEDELAEAVRGGRRREFATFAAFADSEQRERIPDPNDPATFERSRPDFKEIAAPNHAAWHDFHRTLLHLRHQHITPRLAGATSIAAEKLGAKAVLARWRMGDGGTLTLALNLDDTPVACPRMEGDIIFATNPQARDGTLPPACAIVTLS